MLDLINCLDFNVYPLMILYQYLSLNVWHLLQICLQPLVNPLDTKCGHTYCSRCLKNYLKIQRQCPVDRQPLAVHDVQSSSILVRRWVLKPVHVLTVTITHPYVFTWSCKNNSGSIIFLLKDSRHGCRLDLDVNVNYR